MRYINRFYLLTYLLLFILHVYFCCIQLTIHFVTNIAWLLRVYLQWCLAWFVVVHATRRQQLFAAISVRPSAMTAGVMLARRRVLTARDGDGFLARLSRRPARPRPWKPTPRRGWPAAGSGRRVCVGPCVIVTMMMLMMMMIIIINFNFQAIQQVKR